MILHRQRANKRTKSVSVTLHRESGTDELIFIDEKGNRLTFIFDTRDEVSGLLSQAHVIHHNFEE